MGRVKAVHLAGQENPYGNTLKTGMMEQMAPCSLLWSLPDRCYRCEKMSELDGGPVLGVPPQRWLLGVFLQINLNVSLLTIQGAPPAGIMGNKERITWL